MSTGSPTSSVPAHSPQIERKSAHALMVFPRPGSAEFSNGFWVPARGLSLFGNVRILVTWFQTNPRGEQVWLSGCLSVPLLGRLSFRVGLFDGDPPPLPPNLTLTQDSRDSPEAKVGFALGKVVTDALGCGTLFRPLTHGPHNPNSKA